MSDFISPPSSRAVYNILLLGETGAGKSTTINALANYLRFANFDEAAAAGNFEELIPSRFRLPDPETGEPMIIGSDKTDPNERQMIGKSGTKSPMAYIFPLGKSLIRLIDTPGIGDTQGIVSDRENFDKILGYLHFHKTIHGIIILLNSTGNKHSATFRYCLTELLTYLHRSASKNIVFCFTFSKNSRYGPGDGYSMVQEFLKNDLPELKLTLKNGGNSFFIDNEGYRYLMAKKQNYPFDPDEEKEYKQSWDKSVNQSERMIEYIVNLEAHDLEKTISLNHARKLILELAEPMVKLQFQSNVTIEVIKAKKKELLTSGKTKLELAEKLNLEVDDLEKIILKYPSTVCTSHKCIEVIQFQGKQKINYKTRCHENCKLTDVQTDRVGNPILKGCTAMKDSLKCARDNCGCPWDKHMHITCEYKKVKRIVIDSNKQKEIESIEDAEEEIKEFLNKLEVFLQDYAHELKVIQKVCAKFAYILTSNSNMPYNKFIEPYLDILINEEDMKISVIKGYPDTFRKSLMEMKETHQINVEILTNAIENQQHENVKIEDIQAYRSELLQLQHTGPQFRQILEVSKSYLNTALNNVDRSVFNLSNGNMSGFLTKIRRLWY